MVEVEIGSGKGQYLIERALQNPHIHFVGIERRPAFIRRAVEKATRRGITNLKFIQADARVAVRGLDPTSVSVFHVYFPDPWFKRKHLRRRLVDHAFLGLLYSRLQPGGLLEIATDERDYFQKIKNEIARSKAPWQAVREGVNQRLRGESAKTLFESRYAREGRELYYLELRKNGSL